MIRHDVKEVLRDIRLKTEVKTADQIELQNKGFMTKSCFEALVSFTKKETQLSGQQIREFLVKLNLATEIKDNDESLYIPSLISSENEGAIKEQLETFKASKDSLGFYYSFQKSDKASQLYNNLLSKLTSKKHFFYKMKVPGIYFEQSYSAKIENRSLGLVAGLHGSLKWTDSNSVSSTKQKVDFLLLEYDIQDSDMNFATHKVICDL